MNNKNYQELEHDNFDDFLCEYHDGNLLRGVYEYGFERPSPIQSKAIAPMCDKNDVIAQAQSGSGKTGAFVIGMLTRIDPSKKYPQAVIIADTRELASQIHHVTTNLAKYMNINVAICIGGFSGKDVNGNLAETYDSHVLIGTPGRLNDLIDRDANKRSKCKLLDRLQMLILDEADKMLSDNFVGQVQEIIKKVPSETQICLFSATYPQYVLDLTNNFMTNPVRILVEREKVSVELIKNYFVDAQYENYKYDILVELYQKVSVCQTVIFVNSIKKATDLSVQLKQDGHAVGTIHSKLSDVERCEILKNFRLTRTRILVATDIISRGIDIQQVGLVINYDVPYEPEQYVHRVGRSGRFGKLGVAITFITKHKGDTYKMDNIEMQYSIKFSCLPSLDSVNNYLTGIKGYTYTESK